MDQARGRTVECPQTTQVITQESERPEMEGLHRVGLLAITFVLISVTFFLGSLSLTFSLLCIYLHSVAI